jgi:hypothetical protein
MSELSPSKIPPRRKAMQGEWEHVPVAHFKIEEPMTMEFEGVSCNILNEKGQVAGPFSEKDALVIREVLPGETCYVLHGRIRFKKSMSQ